MYCIFIVIGQTYVHMPVMCTLFSFCELLLVQITVGVLLGKVYLTKRVSSQEDYGEQNTHYVSDKVTDSTTIKSIPTCT